MLLSLESTTTYDIYTRSTTASLPPTVTITQVCTCKERETFLSAWMKWSISDWSSCRKRMRVNALGEILGKGRIYDRLVKKASSVL
jgi:hypothetical protein